MTVNRRRLVCFALALSLLLSLIPTGIGRHPAALAETKRLGITLDKVNMRYGAGTGEKIAFSLPKDHVCEIVGEKDADKIHWYRVRTIDPSRKNSNTYFGYIHGGFFRELTDEEYATYAATGTAATPTPIPQSNGDQPTPTPTPAPAGKGDLPAKAGSMGVVTAGGTNMREGPGTGYHSLMKLDRNTQVELLTIPTVRGGGSGTFFKVRYDGVTGYIMSDFISILSGGPESGESIAATPAPTPANSSSDSSSRTMVKLILSSCHLRTSPGGDYDPKNDWTGQGSTLPLAGSAVKQGGYTWYPVSKNGKTYYARNDCVQTISDGGSSSPSTPTAAPDTSAATTVLGYVRTIVGGCNLRATINGTVVKQIAKNVTLPYLLQPVQKNNYTWYFVQDGSTKGYLRGDIVRVVSDTTPTPTPPSGETPTPAPENQPTGWVKTTAGGVNLRKNAGYSDVIGTVSRNTVLPYYGSPTTVKGVQWYQVVHPTLGKGWLHGNYVTPCNQDGSAIATPTPEPGVTSSPDSGGNGQEASYTTLKTGSTGQAVKNLVTELKNQGYYTGDITNKYTTAVAEAVKAFQRAKGLSADGIAGSSTQHKLFGTVPVGSGDTSNLTMTLYPAEKIDWYTGGINELWARGSNYKVYDVKTGIVWWAHRWAGGLHVDAEPLTAADTARLCRCYGVSNSTEIASRNLYQRRPLLVTIGTRTFACSLYGVPHNYPEGDTISTNDFKGQVCIHFTNSKTHDSKKVDSGHEAAIQYAWEYAPNGHK
jgi:peptidoglycan hydrolase-like protein with peptidoglycan-binding domain